MTVQQPDAMSAGSTSIKRVLNVDMLRFIMRQPDDKEVNFNENHITDQCGCLMIQYARENFSTVVKCCSTRFYDGQYKVVAEMTLSYDRYKPPGLDVCTYKKLKEFVSAKWEFMLSLLKNDK